MYMETESERMGNGGVSKQTSKAIFLSDKGDIQQTLGKITMITTSSSLEHFITNF